MLGFGSAAFRCIADRGVDSLSVVVRDVFAKKTSQVVLAEHNHVIEQLSTDTAHETLRRPVLPWAPECGTAGTDAECGDRSGHFRGKDGVVVENQIPMDGFLGKRIAELLDHPVSGRVCGHRKLAVLLHRLWVTGEDYQALGYGRSEDEQAA